MKLNCCESKLSSGYLFSYSKIVLLTFSFLYFVLPCFLQFIVGERFYIYSVYQYKVAYNSIYFFFVVYICIYYLIKDARRHSFVNISPPDNASFKIFFFLNILYLCIIVIRGILFRLGGATREYLLESISSQLIPGYGYLLLLACISVIYLKKTEYLFLFVLICLAIDLIYQGKIFSTNAVMVVMFYLDNIKMKISLKILLIIGISGLGFLFMIFAIRAFGSDNGLMNVYSLFSEFMGVNATVGWSYDYHKSNMPMAFIDFDAILQDYYIMNTGHGLALSPVAYFVGNFGEYYAIASAFFLILLYLIYHLSAMLIGRFALFVFMYDFIHLLRHGPNLFLSKSITHLLFLIIVLVIFDNYKNSKGNLISH